MRKVTSTSAKIPKNDVDNKKAIMRNIHTPGRNKHFC